MADEKKAIICHVNDSLTVTHMSDVMQKSLTTAHFQQKLETPVPVQTDNSGNTGGSGGSSGQTGDSEK